MLKLKVIEIGKSVGVILPAEALAHLRVSKGDRILLMEEKDGFRITRCDPQFKKTMGAARRVMGRRRKALRELGG